MEMSASLVVCIKGTVDKATKERRALKQRAKTGVTTKMGTKTSVSVHTPSIALSHAAWGSFLARATLYSSHSSGNK